MTNKELLTYILSHIHIHGTDDSKEFREVLEAIPSLFKKAEKYDELVLFQEYKEIINNAEEKDI